MFQKKGSRDEAVEPPSNLNRLHYNSSAAKSHSTTTQYRQLRRLGYLQKVDSEWDEPCDFFRILLREMTINQMILKSIAR